MPLASPAIPRGIGVKPPGQWNEQRGLRGYAEEAGMSIEETYETLMTGLAVRYYNAVAG